MIGYQPNKKVLYIDDEPHLLQAFKSLMRKEDVEIVTLEDSTLYKEVVENQGPFALILSDQRMPVIKGVEILENITAMHPDTIKMLITGFSDYGDTLRAINSGGISRYISKPWNDNELRNIVKEALSNYNLAKENKYLIEELQKNNSLLTELIEGTVVKTVRLLSDVVGYVNSEAMAQTARVRKLGQIILSTFPDINYDEKWHILCSFDLFNLGIALLPAWLQVSLSKSGLAAINRFPAAKNHHLLAANLLYNIPRFSQVAEIIKYQAKNFDGTGDPSDEVKGTNIPFGARLLNILLEYDRQANENLKGEILLREMMAKPNKFDTEIISRILKHLKPQSAEAKATRKPNEAFNCMVAQLVEGLLVLEDVVSDGGTKLISANTRISKQELDFIRIWSNARREKIKEPIKVAY